MAPSVNIARIEALIKKKERKKGQENDQFCN